MTEHPHPKKRESKHRPYIFHKKLKMDIRSKHKMKTINPLKDNIGENLDDHWYGNIFYIYHQRYDL